MLITRSVLLAFVAVYLPHSAGSAELDKVDITSHRPLMELADKLMAKYGVVVSYEDPIYNADSDLTPQPTDGANASELAARKATPKKFLIPRGGSISVATPNGKAALHQPDKVISMVENATAEYNAHDLPGKFRTYLDGSTIIIVPTLVKNAAGQMGQAATPLDLPINLEFKERTGFQLIQEISDQLSKYGTRVEWASWQQNILSQNVVSLAASGETARKVLLRGLNGLHFKDATIAAAVKTPRMTWRLCYSPGLKYYILNIITAVQDAPAAFGGTVKQPIE